MSISRKCCGAFAALTLLLVLGCQSSSTPTGQTMAAPTQAVFVTSSGNGGGTTVFLPSAGPDNPMVFCSSGSTSDVCPECRAAAIKYFKTGILDPKCSRTGAIRTVGKLVPPMTPAPVGNAS